MNKKIPTTPPPESRVPRRRTPPSKVKQLSTIKGMRSSGSVTVSREELLIDGTDAMLRRVVLLLVSIANNTAALRSSYGAMIDITGPQYEILISVSRLNDGKGISVGDISRFFRRTSAFVATETNKLTQLGLLEKRTPAEDRRSTILHITPAGKARLNDLSHYQRDVNDTLFADFNREEFLHFTSLLEKLLPASESACDLIQSMLNAKRRKLE